LARGRYLPLAENDEVWSCRDRGQRAATRIEEAEAARAEPDGVAAVEVTAD
jgi:hypothetical protein